MISRSAMRVEPVLEEVKNFDNGEYLTGSDHNLIFVTLNLKTKTFRPIVSMHEMWIVPWKTQPVFQRELENS